MPGDPDRSSGCAGGGEAWAGGCLAFSKRDQSFGVPGVLYRVDGAVDTGAPMKCKVCSIDDGSQALRETLKKNLTGSALFWCTRFGCGHQWHGTIARECDCSDYIPPPA